MRGKFPRIPRVNADRELEQRRREAERAQRRKVAPHDWYDPTPSGGGSRPPGRTRQVPSTGAPYQTESDGLVLMKPAASGDPGVQKYTTMDGLTEYVVIPSLGGSRLLARRADVEAATPGAPLRIAIARYGP